MGIGSRELVRRASAYMVCTAFGLTFLISTLSGTQGNTALLRGVVVGAITLALSHFLLKPVVDVVLDAMARDRATGEDKR